MKVNHQLQYSFLEGIFSSLIAFNRGYPLEITDQEEYLERSYIGICRLLYYSQSKNDYSRIDKELKYTEYYLKLQRLRYSDTFKYRILADTRSRKWAVQRLRLHNEIGSALRKTSLRDSVEIVIDADSALEKRSLKLTVSTADRMISKTIHLRRMKENHTNYYML